LSPKWLNRPKGSVGESRSNRKQFAVIGAKIGATVNVRRPIRVKGTSGPNLNVEDFNETSIPVTIGSPPYGDQFHTDTQFTTQDLALSIDMFADRVLKPQVAAIANRVDYLGLLMAKNNTANFNGTPGTIPSSLRTYLDGGAFLDSEGTPRDGRRCMVVEPFTSSSIVDSLKGLFMPPEVIGEQYRKGLMGRDSGGMNWKMDQNVITHAFGYGTSAVTLAMNQTNAGLATGWALTTTITISNTGSCLFNQGDVIQIAGVYAVNPQNRQSYGKLRNFVVTANAAAGATTLIISPAIIYGGQFQNVTATPASTATITLLGVQASQAAQISAPQNIMFHRNAFTLAVADLELPEGVHFAGRASDEEIGLSIRVVRQYTINNDSIPTRLDVLFGWAPLYPELACRITS
jgi:hypothetical protein